MKNNELDKFLIYFKNEYEKSIYAFINDVKSSKIKVDYSVYSKLLGEKYNKIISEFLKIEGIQNYRILDLNNSIDLSTYLKMNSVKLKKELDSMLFNEVILKNESI